MSDINVQANTIIGIYENREDYKNKNAKKTYLSDGTPQNYKAELNSIIDSIKWLDGNCNDLTDADLALAAQKATDIFGQKAVIRRDAAKGLSTIQLENGKVYSFDFYLENEKTNGVKQLEKDIANGDAEYTPWYSPDKLLCNLIESGGASLFQNEITVKCPNGTTMGEVKEKYNLPDGALKSYVCCGQLAGGNRDTYTVDGGMVWFSAEAFAKNNGLTLEQVKSFFKK